MGLKEVLTERQNLKKQNTKLKGFQGPVVEPVKKKRFHREKHKERDFLFSQWIKRYWQQVKIEMVKYNVITDKRYP